MLAGTDGLPFAVAEVVGELTRGGALRVRRRPLDRSQHRPRSPGRPPRSPPWAVAGGCGRRWTGTRPRPYGPGAAVPAGPAGARPTLAAAAVAPAEEVLGSLARLAAADLVRLGERGWATSHDLVRETVAADLDAAERGRLHARLAVALAGADADPAELARHHAGAGDAEAAARCYATAARQRVEGADDGSVAELAEAGLALAGRGEARSQLLEVRAQLRARRGDLPAARADLRDALAGSTDPAVRSGLRARLAMLYSGAEDLDRAAGLAELAVLDAGTDPAALARALEVAAIVDMNREQADRARQRFDRALALYQDGHDAAGAARILDARAMATFLDGGISAATTLFTQVADLFTDSGDLLHAITPTSTAGHALVFAADPAAGLALITGALELARSLGHQEGITYALWHRSEALAALGRTGEAAETAREALAVAERLGHRGWTATALRALGIALDAGGDPAGAAEAFRRSLATASGLTLFSSWAACPARAGRDRRRRPRRPRPRWSTGRSARDRPGRVRGAAGPGGARRRPERPGRRGHGRRRGPPGPGRRAPRLGAPAGGASSGLVGVRQLVVGEPGPQVLLGELADRGLRHLVDEHHVVRQPPLRHPRRRNSISSSLVAVASGLSTTAASGRSCQRGCGTAMTAASATAGWAIRWFSSSTELIHSPPDFTRSLVRSESRMLPCGSIAPTSPVRSQPSAVNESSRVLDPVVVGGDPRPAHLQLAGRLVVPGQLGRACRARRSGRPPRPAAMPCRARTSAASSPLSPSYALKLPVDRAERAGLGHAPGVQDRHPELLLVRLGQRLRHRRAAAQDRPQRRQVAAVELRQHAHPDRRHAGGHRDPLLLEHRGDRGRRHLRAGQHQLGAGEQRRVPPAPGVRVEHRHHRQHPVALHHPDPGRRR